MKRTRISNNDEEQEDRISSLPDVLLISVFSLTDTKLAVKSSILSKRWVNLWTMIHVLNFDSSMHNIGFDTFIDKVFTYRNVSVEIHRMLKLVFLNLKGIISVNLEAYEIPLRLRLFLDVVLSLIKTSKKDNAMNIFKRFGNAKCVQLSLSTIEVLLLHCN
ncbi:F-box domain, cyclin-like protein [Tanacetum coccineum]